MKGLNYLVLLLQNRVTADFSIPKRGKYVLVVQYFRPSDDKGRMSVYLRYPRGTQRGEFDLQSCNYRFGCRQVAVEPSGAVKVFDVAEIQRMVVTLLSRSDSPVAVVGKLGSILKVILLILLANYFCYHFIYKKCDSCKIIIKQTLTSKTKCYLKFLNSLIIHDKNTKEITTVKEVLLSCLNLSRYW